MFSKALLASAFAALAAAQSTVLTFTHVPNPVTDGVAQAITYATNDTTTPVTITLRKGESSNLQTLQTLTTDASGGQYVWTPSTSLPDGDDYALEIRQGNQINYYGPFTVQGQTTTSSSSAASSSSSGTKTKTGVAGSSTTSGTSTANSTTSASNSTMTTSASNSTTTMGAGNSTKTTGGSSSSPATAAATTSGTAGTSGASGSAAATSAAASHSSSATSGASAGIAVVSTGSSLALVLGAVAAILYLG